MEGENTGTEPQDLDNPAGAASGKEQQKPGQQPTGEQAGEGADDEHGEGQEGQVEAGEGEGQTDDDEGQSGQEETDGEEGEERAKPKLTRSQRERRARIKALERAELAEARVAELEARQRGQGQPENGQQQQTRQPGHADYDPEPQLGEYENTTDPQGFHKLAHDQWRVRVAQRAADETARGRAQHEQRSERQQAIHRELVEGHEEREAELRKTVKDYDAVLERAAPVARHVGQLIIQSEMSAKVSYHLAKNPTELRALNEMTPVQAAMALGRLETKLSLPQGKKQTNAPAPFTNPKGGGAKPTTDIRKLAESDDATAFAKQREAQIAARKGAAKR